MNKLFFGCIMLLAGVQACGSKTDKVAIERGRILIEASDCRTCHHNTTTIVGPAYAEVAKKYEPTEANINLLAGKIVKGGSGVWGDIPMTAHTDLTEDDARKMVQYILSVKQ
jgi:cytochrome c